MLMLYAATHIYTLHCTFHKSCKHHKQPFNAASQIKCINMCINAVRSAEKRDTKKQNNYTCTVSDSCTQTHWKRERFKKQNN